MQPTTTPVEQHVLRLLQSWRADIALISSSTEITQHPAYLELISLGSEALPTLWRDLEQSHDGHLSKALTAITGAYPIAPEDRGKVRKIAETWLRWACEHGHQW